MVVTRKYGSYGQRTLRVATYLRTNLLVTPTTGTSNVRYLLLVQCGQGMLNPNYSFSLSVDIYRFNFAYDVIN